MSHIPSSKVFVLGGVQKTYHFSNGYGASVVCHNGSYGGPYIQNSDKNLWELAVLDGDDITYHTPITQDVVGHQSESEVEILLKEISELTREIVEKEEQEYQFAAQHAEQDYIDEYGEDDVNR
jgi:hypothetical protein